MNSKRAVWLKVSGISGILAPLVAFTFISLAIVYSPQFSWTENALSDLGVQEGVTAILFNYGLIIVGILALVFASGLFASQRMMLGRIGAFILILAALALMAIGVFPENVKPTHYYVSVGFFVLLPISILVLSATFLLTSKVKLGLFTFLVAAVAAAVWIIHWTIPFGSGVAIPEALSAVSASTCSIVLGFKMLKEASHSTKQ
jgi:hypothetical membrane protein